MTVPPTAPVYEPDAAAAPMAPRVRDLERGNPVLVWLEENARVVVGVSVAALVAGAGAYFWRESERGAAARADQALYQAEAQLAQGDPGAPRALQQISTRYGNAPAAVQARALLAEAAYDRQQYAEGVRLADPGAAPAPMRDGVAALRAIGEQGLGRGREAAAELEGLAKGAGPEHRSELVGDAARMYQDAGDLAGARRAWRAVLDGGVRGAADEARIRLGELDAAGP